MRLAAIYIYDHFLFENSKTINFGSKYNYDIETDGKFCSIKRKENLSFISNFFAEDTIINISAIVGTNGVGKTTILKEITDLFGSRYGTKSIIIFESDDEMIIHKNHYEKRIITEIKYRSEIIDFQTIYYSPFLDFKEPFSGIDLSFDNLLSFDLDNMKGVREGNERVIPIERLKQKNSKRIRNLKNSEFAHSISKIFDFPEDDLHRVTFTRHIIDANEKEINFHNTPMDFRFFLDELFLKIRNENKNANRSVNNEFERFQLQKNLYKNYLLMDVLCLLVNLMESKNTYLSEGHFISTPYDKQKELVKKLSAFELLEFWLSNYKYSKGKPQPLPHKEVLDLLNFIYEYLDKIECDEFGKSELFDWGRKNLYFNSENLDKLFLLDKALINKLPMYYSKTGVKNETYYDLLSELSHFTNLEPSTRNLSSGETAMLNLFSRIYDYFDNRLLQIQTEKKYANYLLLLDEADLGFHPQWKKNFITILITFIKDFFLKIGSEVQIIFTTHDPLTLSELPNYNIIYLDKDNSGKSQIMKYDDPKRPKKSFAANITELLADSFFVKEGLIGKFASDKIDKTIQWLNSKDKSNNEYHKKLIQNIDEPIIQRKLAEMYSEKMQQNLSKEILKKEIEMLTERLNNL
ncbi:putative AbiEii toxin of type IV toxin-antitoxin system [Flavobacterium sp. 9]|uniref:AAA family ATPase n=1 Tax=Flavobacterium sp. 9 TaxID=2035198 RepID=UPI000C1A4998|nr:AAA family ATPase [Flavobacterium sp. 9]PIF29987.1 putative AbiEii toxin of type IV toxin-antitoxin system [Flavobacterium sp. 9]